MRSKTDIKRIQTGYLRETQSWDVGQKIKVEDQTNKDEHIVGTRYLKICPGA